jgi:hypothetical protein
MYFLSHISSADSILECKHEFELRDVNFKHTKTDAVLFDLLANTNFRLKYRFTGVQLQC